CSRSVRELLTGDLAIDRRFGEDPYLDELVGEESGSRRGDDAIRDAVLSDLDDRIEMVAEPAKGTRGFVGQRGAHRACSNVAPVRRGSVVRRALRFHLGPSLRTGSRRLLLRRCFLRRAHFVLAGSVLMTLNSFSGSNTVTSPKRVRSGPIASASPATT